MNGRVKLFLGAYVNSTNAQNLNCLALAKYLDKSQFDITTLSLYSEPSILLDGVHIHKCKWPHRIFIYWAFFWNIIKADVVYLPKAELLRFNSFLCQKLGKKSFSTIEGVLDEIATQSMISKAGKDFVKFHHRLSKRYSITSFMKDYNFKNHNLKTQKEILYLGTETEQFTILNKPKSNLQNVIMIGNDLVRKGVKEFLELAKIHKTLQFHIVGSGNGKIDVNTELTRLNLSNVFYHGLLNQLELKELLSQMHLHVFPSRSEGFPKVILETACAGIPSILYSDYGASEWITHKQNGFLVETFNEMSQIIKELTLNQEQLFEISEHAIKLGLSYDWQIKIKDWEDVFLFLANE